MPSGGMELWREADSVLKEEPDVESKKSHDFREFFVQIHFRILDFLCHTLLCFDFDSSRDPQHSASVQLVVNSNYP